MTWSTYVALGDSLTAGKGDAGRDGHQVGWAQRLADILSVRTAARCRLTNLAVDGVTVSQVLADQLPAVAGTRPDLLSVTVGMNDIRARGFDEMGFKAALGQLLEVLAATEAAVLTCTLPDITAIMELSPEMAEIARERTRQASDIIREQAESYGAVCLDPIAGAISSWPRLSPTSWPRAGPAWSPITQRPGNPQIGLAGDPGVDGPVDKRWTDTERGG